MPRRHEGLILGRSLGASEPVGFSRGKRPANPAGRLITYAGDGHLMTIAPTGTGKTSGPVITNALTHQGQLIVIDIKGEVYRATASARRKIGRVHVLDLRDNPVGNDSLNPIDLAALGGEEVGVLAQSLASDLVVRTGSEKETFWNDWAETLIAGAIAHVMEDALPEKRNLAHIFEFFHHEEGRYKIAEMTDPKTTKSKAAQSAFSAFLNIASDVTSSGIMSTTQQQIRLFGSELAKRVTSTTTINLADLVSGKPMTIYIVVPPHRLRAYRPLLRSMLSGLIMAFTQRKEMPAHRTLMLCDEIGNLGYLEAFVTAATLLRGWGVTLWTFWQNLSQLEQYGHDARTLIDNAGVIQIFGARNFRAAQDFVNLVGGISADEIMQLAPNEQILLIEGGYPVRGKTIRYFEDSLFTGKYDSASTKGATR